jgi:hypothetical protein
MPTQERAVLTTLMPNLVKVINELILCTVTERLRSREIEIHQCAFCHATKFCDSSLLYLLPLHVDRLVHILPRHSQT